MRRYPAPKPGVKTSLKISNITFKDIVATSSKISGEFDCVDDSPCYGITVINVTHGGKAPQPWMCKNVHGTVIGVTPPLTCFLP